MALNLRIVLDRWRAVSFGEPLPMQQELQPLTRELEDLRSEMILVRETLPMF